MTEMRHILFVQNTNQNHDSIMNQINNEGFIVTHKNVTTLQDLSVALEENTWDMVISDFGQTHFDKLQAVNIIKKQNQEIPLLFFNDCLEKLNSGSLMRGGVSTFLCKNNEKLVIPTIQKEFQNYRRQKKLVESDQKLLAAQRLATLGSLTSSIAHDFNNIMTILVSQTNDLLLTTEHDDVNYRRFNNLSKAIERGLKLSKQLISYSKNQHHNPQVINLNRITQDMEELLRSLIGKDVVIKTSLAPILPEITVDQNQIEQIIMNLAINARDAMPHYGILTITTSGETINSSSDSKIPEGTYAVLSITDTGHGISEEILSKIFNPFFTTKPTHKGTGLGLAIVQELVLKNNAYITVESEINKGTAFKIFFPTVS